MALGRRTLPSCWTSARKPSTPTAPASCANSTSTTWSASSSSPSNGTLRRPATPRVNRNTYGGPPLPRLLIQFEVVDQFVYRLSASIQSVEGLDANVVGNRGDRHLRDCCQGQGPGHGSSVYSGVTLG